MNDPLTDLAPTLKSSDNSAEPFISSAHQQLISKLEHLSRYSSVIQIVTGPQGSGKSTFIQHLSTSFSDQEAVTLHLSPNYETSPEDLLRQLSSGLEGFSEESIDTGVPSIQHLETKLESLKSNNRFLCLLIEHGEALNTQAIKLVLEQLQGMNEAIRPHIIIFAQPVFAEKISQSSQFKSIPKSQCHFVEIPPYEFLDTQAFIQYTYPEESSLLTEDRIKQVHQEAFGLPGLIEKSLNKEILQPSDPKKSINVGKVAGTGLMLILVLGIGGAASYILWTLYTQPSSETEQVSINLPTPVETLARPTEAPMPAQPAAIKTETTPVKPTTPSVDKPVLSIKTQEASISTADISTTEETKKDTDSSPDNLDIATTTPISATEPTTDEDIAPVLTTPAQNKLVLQIKPTEPKTTEPTANDSKPAANIPSSTITPATKPASSEVKPLLIKPSHPFLREDELLSWNANGYTLQMLGARKESSVISFIQARSDKNNFYYFSTIYKEKPWYVVVYGQYQNRDKAVAAIRTLPTDLKQRKPWARSIKGVQDDIRRK